MADIDAELLALAGDASSDEEDAPMNISGASSDASGERDRDGSAKPGKKSGGRRGRKGDQNDSEEEGEASSGPGSPDSQQSAPMDESDSDSDTSPANMFDDTENRYPLEGKFKDASDKASIMAMPEINREEILAERAQTLERDRQNRALRLLLNARETDGKKQDKKRKAGAADLEEHHRKTSRQRTKVGGGKFGESSTGLENLRRARAEKDDLKRRRERDSERTRDRREIDDYSDADADGESEPDCDEKKAIRSQSVDSPDAKPATSQDVERIRVGRTRFAQVCFYPGFEEAITGCFVRVSVGQDPENGKNIYRMGLIKGFSKGTPYAVENPYGKPVITDQYVAAAHGKSVRTSPFLMCSDSPFTEAEFIRFQKFCQSENVPIPTKQKLENKADDINNLIHRTWTEAELQEKLVRSGALMQKQLPLQRTRIINEIKDAQATGNEERVEELRAELAKLEGPKLAFNTSMTAKARKGAGNTGGHKAQQERIAQLNMENRRKNTEAVRQAQINERRAAKRVEAAIKRGEVVVEDHSKRVKTRAIFKHDVSDTLQKKDVEESGTNNETTKVAAKVVSHSTPKTPQYTNNGNTKGLPGLRRPLQDDDIIASIDLGIELEL